MTRRAAAAISAGVLGVWVLVRWVIYDYPQLGDTRVYQHAVRMIDAGFVPYRDFDIEYPPLATAFFWLIGQVPGPPTLIFSAAMGACLVATALAAWIAGGQLGLARRRRVATLVVIALTPLLLGTLLQTRYDLALSALLGWMLVAALARRFAWMWALLAIATAIKLVPLFLVPVACIWHWRHRGTRPAAIGAAAFIAAVTATFLPFALIAPSGTWQLFRYHLARPLQMESLGSSLIHALGLPFRQVQSYGSDNVDGTLPALAAATSTVLLLLAIVLIARRLVRATEVQASDAAFVAALAATMVAAIVFGKVLSPQYLAWMLPVALLIPGRPGALAAGALTLAMPITQLVFPALYTELVQRSAPLPVALLAGRNGLLLLVLAAVTATVRGTMPAAPGKRRPGRKSVLSSSTSD